MAKNDWKALQSQFENDTAKSGISPKEWCEAKGLNYQTARRYIKVRKTAQESAQNVKKKTAQNKKNAQKVKSRKSKIINPDNSSHPNNTNASQPPANTEGRNTDEEIAEFAQGEIAQNGGGDRRESGKSAQKSAQNFGGNAQKSAQKLGENAQKHEGENAQTAQFDGGGHSGERDDRGWFKKGNQVAVGNGGNPDPENQFQKGNQFGRTSGIYSRFFPEEKQTLFEYSEIATLKDELALTRARLQSGIEFLNRVADDIVNAGSMEEKIKLYEQYQKTEMRMDILTGRIESITKTLSNLRIDDVSEHKIVADTKRIKNASRKLGLEADNLQKEGKGDDTPVSDIVSDIQSMGKSGLMSE